MSHRNLLFSEVLHVYVNHLVDENQAYFPIMNFDESMYRF